MNDYAKPDRKQLIASVATRSEQISAQIGGLIEQGRSPFSCAFALVERGFFHGCQLDQAVTAVARHYKP